MLPPNGGVVSRYIAMAKTSKARALGRQDLISLLPRREAEISTKQRNKAPVLGLRLAALAETFYSLFFPLTCGIWGKAPRALLGGVCHAGLLDSKNSHPSL